MKRKVLFIISNMETGGVSKSMASLMNIIDRERYNVSLMILSPTGAFMELLPKELRLITNPIWSALTSKLSGTLNLIKMGHPFLAIGHFLRLIISLFSKSSAAEIIASLMPPVKEEFDTIIDFNGQHQLYYMVEKLNAKKKVSFFHSDYNKWPYYYKSDKKYFPQIDNIFTISNECVKSLLDYFPECANKIGLMENISSLQLIQKMADQDPPDIIDRSFMLLTIGHVCENKGIYWAIEAASILKKRSLRFHWYFIGSIDKVEEYKNHIAKYNVDDRITFLGIRVNPYPYINKADIIVHPSKFEGRSIALDEAKLLCKPVVVTNFSTVHDQFIDGYNGSICQMDAQSIAGAIEDLYKDSTLRSKYSSTLLKDRKDNSNEIEKLYHIIDG